MIDQQSVIYEYHHSQQLNTYAATCKHNDYHRQFYLFIKQKAFRKTALKMYQESSYRKQVVAKRTLDFQWLTHQEWSDHYDTGSLYCSRPISDLTLLRPCRSKSHDRMPTWLGLNRDQYVDKSELTTEPQFFTMNVMYILCIYCFQKTVFFTFSYELLKFYTFNICLKTLPIIYCFCLQLHICAFDSAYPTIQTCTDQIINVNRNANPGTPEFNPTNIRFPLPVNTDPNSWSRALNVSDPDGVSSC